MARQFDGELEDDDVSIVRPEPNALEAITRSEVSMQIEAAHRWPRSVTKFLRSATELACHDEDIAASCMYSVPRAGKMVSGKSIRLAEICASAWGNLHIGARVLDENSEQPIITGQAVVWDLERNVRVTIEAQRGVRNKRGERFEPDMVRTTGMAALSIAYRNAVFRVIPQTYANEVYERAKATAVGDATTLVARREKWFTWLTKTGATPERIFARLGVVGLDDISLAHIETLIGIAQSIRSGELEVDAAFPAVAIAAPGAAPAAPPAAAAAAPEGRRVQVGTGKRGKVAAPAPSAAAAVAPAPTTTSSPAPAAPTVAAPLPGDTQVGPGVAPPPAPAAPGPVDLLELLSALESVDVAWRESGDMTTLEQWSEEQRRAALLWADAVLNNRGPMAVQLARPPHTVVATREPGED